jgi:ABC-type iron transport system FetAB permease component
MNSHNITNESLALALMLVVVAILISHKEKLALEKDILWSVGRAIIQLIIVGYVLTSSPSNSNVPLVGLINEATIFSSVLLPQPEGPVINLNSPARSEKLMLLRIFASPARYPTFCS